jgi:DNA-binding MarR family transcriptional regulator
MMMANPNAFLFLTSRLRDEAYRFLADELNQQGLTGLTPTHGAILNALFLHERLPMGRLAELIGKDKSTVTALVKKLIDYKYVEKTTGADDMRVTMVRLTPHARGLAPRLMEISGRLRKTAYKGLSRAEQMMLVELLERVIGNFSTE